MPANARCAPSSESRVKSKSKSKLSRSRSQVRCIKFLLLSTPTLCANKKHFPFWRLVREVRSAGKIEAPFRHPGASLLDSQLSAPAH